MECCIHSEKGGDPTDTALQISAKSGKTILYYAHEWMTTRDGYGRSYSVIASKLVNELVGNDHIFPASCGYHRKCYQLFTNKKNMESSRKRSIQTANDDINNGNSIPRKKTRQSEAAVTHIVKTTVALFGNICILCQRNKYKKDNTSGSWKLESLTKCTCMSPSAEAAIKSAAREKQDEKVLLIDAVDEVFNGEDSDSDVDDCGT